MFTRILVIILLIIPLTFQSGCVITEMEITDLTDYPCSYYPEAEYMNKYPVEEVMAAVVYHECYNLSKLERWLVMEAFYNRIICNFNNNGKTVKQQILAKKQFTGLFTDNPQQFIYNDADTLCLQNVTMARAIIAGCRMSDRIIFYWAGECDRSTSHGRWVNRNKLKLPSTIKSWFR